VSCRDRPKNADPERKTYPAGKPSGLGYGVARCPRLRPKWLFSRLLGLRISTGEYQDDRQYSKLCRQLRRCMGRLEWIKASRDSAGPRDEQLTVGHDVGPGIVQVVKKWPAMQLADPMFRCQSRRLLPGSMASRRSRTETLSRNCLLPSSAVPMKARWALFWSKESSFCPRRATMPRRFSAMQLRRTGWTPTPSPSRSNRSSRPRTRRKRSASPHRNQPPKPRKLPSSAARETRSANQQTSFHFPMRPSFPPSAVARALARTPWPSHPTG
jgi:hypothetical protein